ncbi:MAG: DMT family transporter [Alkalilacustris sp.]
MAEAAPPRASVPAGIARRRGHLAMLAFAALVAGSFGLGGLAAPHVDPRVLTTLRFAVAAGVMAALVVGQGARIRRAHLVAPWRWPLLGAVFASYFVLMFEALKTATPISTSAVFTLTPLMAAGFGWWLLGQRLSPRMAGALAVGAAGAVWVIFRADLGALMAFQPGRGEAIFLVGCAAHALFTPLVARLNRGEPAAISTCLVMLGGLGVLVAVSAAPLLATDWGALPAVVWITAVYLGIPATAVTYLLLRYATLRLPAAKVMAYTYLVPSFVILWELALGQPAPPVLVLPGVGLCAVALVLLLKHEDQRRDDTRPGPPPDERPPPDPGRAGAASPRGRARLSGARVRPR